MCLITVLHPLAVSSRLESWVFVKVFFFHVQRLLQVDVSGLGVSPSNIYFGDHHPNVLLLLLLSRFSRVRLCAIP